MQDAYLVAYNRSAVTKAKKGGFRFMRSDDLAVMIIQGLLAKVPEVSGSLIDDIIVGCANPEGEQGLQIGRQIALRAVGISAPGMTVNRYCASGLETIAIATAKIRAGMGECFIAGGIESMSQIPMEGYKLALNYDVADQHPDYIIGMGLTAEAVAKKYHITREDQDAFSFRSHALANKAQELGYSESEIQAIDVTEVLVEQNKRIEKKYTVKADDGIRKDTTLEGLSTLKPVFALGGSVTAGNSSQTSDGAAFFLVMSERLVRSLGITPIGRLVSCSVAGVEPLYMGIGPCEAIPLALRQAQLKLDDISLIELNEAFAAQSLAVIRQAGLNPDIVNVNGGAIALGHPLGCSGARLSMSLMNELDRRKQQYGIVTACVGGGQGIAGVIERF